MSLKPKKYILAVAVLMVGMICTSLFWNLLQQKRSAELENLKTARAFVQQILITRAWNASHAGVYLHVSGDVQPNPYLDIPGKTIETVQGSDLTLVNPAFMTRMISELALEQGRFRFHLTSLKPINPANGPLPWEEAALKSFENSQKGEFYFTGPEGSGEHFNYMVPLVTEKPCLKCHAKQGYRGGDVRGGISVTFPTEAKETGTLIMSHLMILSVGVILIFGFGTRLVRLTEDLKKQSHVDGLTQIANRTYFDERFHREWLRSRRGKTPLSLIMCDIDYFKLYNDTYGHQAGDRCLRKTAQALRLSVNRPADIVARYGGEEFVAVLPETSREGAFVIAKNMQAAVKQLQIKHEASKTADYVTVSLGVATMTDPAITEEKLIEQADKALYASKYCGRNIVSHADDLEL